MSNLVELSKAHRLRALNKSEAAQFFDVSLPTVEAWIRRGCPVTERGGRGKPWVLDALEIARWKFSEGAEVEPLQNPDLMIPTDRKAWFESEKTRMAIQEKARELIPASEVQTVISTTYSKFSQGVRSLTDKIERTTGCPPEVLVAIEEALLAELDAVADNVSTIGAVDIEHD